MKRVLAVLFFLLPSASLACSSSSEPTTQDGADGSTSAPCDAPAMVLKPTCGVLLCHEPTNMPANAGLDFSKTTGLVAMLLGKTSKGTGGSACGSNTTPYLQAGSNPAAGLLIDKLFATPPPCGASMPYGGTPLSGSEAACVKSWAVAVTTGVITQ
jgi:hypothetical protein